jgi:16S rRNA (guanine966-N2)-methyltransferase
MTTRPTGDRVRESMFNILRHGKFHSGGLLEQAKVLDVFAGTGALGLEALSQGAQQAVFIEQDMNAFKVCQENIALLKETPRCSLLKMDALQLPPRPIALEPRSLVFLDPPYGKNMGAAALQGLAKGGWLTEGAVCVLEMAKAAPETLPLGFTLQDERIYGVALVYFMVYTKAVEKTDEPIQI